MKWHDNCQYDPGWIGWQARLRLSCRTFQAAHNSDGHGQANVRCAAMARETVYILQAYVAGRGKGLKAEPQVGCKTAEEARRKAERLAPLRLGVVAFAASADVEMGDYDDNPVILFKSGQLPPPWNED
jgi:hypothetical protein